MRTARERRLFLTFPWKRLPGRPAVGAAAPGRAPGHDRSRARLVLHARHRGVLHRVAGRARRRHDRGGRGHGGHGDATGRSRRKASGASSSASTTSRSPRRCSTRAKAWCRARGLARMVGPFFLEREDCYGILVEGRDRPPVLLCGHTPPYYQAFVERCGGVPDPMESLAFEVRLDEDSKEWEKVGRMADRIRRRGWITLRTPDKARWRDEVPVIKELLDKALAHLPGATPWQLEDRRGADAAVPAHRGHGPDPVRRGRREDGGVVPGHPERQRGAHPRERTALPVGLGAPGRGHAAHGRSACP